MVCSCFCTLWFLGFGHTRCTTLKDLVLHSRACCYALGPSIAHALARTHTQVMLRFGSFHTRREGAERANTGTASLCGKATEKVAPEASLKPGHRTPFWRIQAADGTKRGPAAGKGRSLRSGCGNPFLKDPGWWRHKKGSSSRELEGMCGCCWAPPNNNHGIPVFVCTPKGRNRMRYIVRTGSQCLFVPCCCCCLLNTDFLWMKQNSKISPHPHYDFATQSHSCSGS